MQRASRILGSRGILQKIRKEFWPYCQATDQSSEKGELFVWTHIHEQAFSTLKQSLTTAPVLALPNFDKPFAIEADASGTGIGAVLLQQEHPLAFVSKALGPRNQGLSTYEKEYLAIILAVDQWRHYLQHSEFVIYSDHRSLSHLT